MTPELRFTVFGQPLTWKRTNTYKGRRITPREQRQYQGLIKLVAREAAGSWWPLDERYKANLIVYTKDKRRSDLDNYVKQFGDACNGVVWKDDSQIDEWWVVRQIDKACPRVEVCVRTVEA